MPIFILACVFGAGIFSGCAQSSPVIRSHLVQLLRVQNSIGEFEERLSVFVFWDDDDGPDDFASITVTHAETGLYWEVLPETAVMRLRGKDRWVGTNTLAGPGGAEIPAGTYRILVTDLAGKESPVEFNLVRPLFPAQTPVAFSISGTKWILEKNPAAGDFARSFLILSNSDGELVYSWRVPDSSQKTVEGEMDTLRNLAEDATSVQCYTENSGGSAGVLLTLISME